MSDSGLRDRLDAAVAGIQARCAVVPRVGIVLGSGLGGLVDAIEQPVTIPYGDIPHFPRSTVAGHAGKLVMGLLAGTPVAVLAGRVHLYEGYEPDDVVFAARVVVRLGASTVVLTNAAGGIHPEFRPGDIMVIRDQINLTGRNPLVGPNDEKLGLRFVDLTEAFDRELMAGVRTVADKRGLELREGVYAGLLGPSYETPAEIRMLRTIGADAVGMSTVLEVIALRHLGARVVALSLITNAAAGLGPSTLSHEEVYAVAADKAGRLVDLISETVHSL